jgi:hypothetical protein
MILSFSLHLLLNLQIPFSWYQADPRPKWCTFGYLLLEIKTAAGHQIFTLCRDGPLIPENVVCLRWFPTPVVTCSQEEQSLVWLHCNKIQEIWGCRPAPITRTRSNNCQGQIIVFKKTTFKKKKLCQRYLNGINTAYLQQIKRVGLPTFHFQLIRTEVPCLGQFCSLNVGLPNVPVWLGQSW